MNQSQKATAFDKKNQVTLCITMDVTKIYYLLYTSATLCRNSTGIPIQVHMDSRTWP